MLLKCTLSVESEPDKGSTFTLKVPKKESFHIIMDEITNKEKEEKLEQNITIKKLEQEKKNIVLIHSNSLKLFSFTIALKKHFLVTPFDSIIKLNEYLQNQEENNTLIIFDESIENIEDLESLILKNKYDSIKLEQNTKVELLIDNIIKKRYKNED